MFPTTLAPSPMDAASVLATTHAADLRRAAAYHAAARRVRASGDTPSFAAGMRTALVRTAAFAAPRRAPRVAEPCPTC